MGKKKETSNIVIYISILFLTLIIALPPILRSFVSKEEDAVIKSTPKEKIILLTCNKISEDGGYQISSKTKYISNKVSNVTLNYQMTTPNVTTDEKIQTEPKVEENVTPPVDSVQPSVTILDPDIDILRNLENATITEDATKFSIVMTKDTLDNNSTMDILNQYFGLLPDQRKYYESLGYTCMKLES